MDYCKQPTNGRASQTGDTRPQTSDPDYLSERWIIEFNECTRRRHLKIDALLKLAYSITSEQESQKGKEESR